MSWNQGYQSGLALALEGSTPGTLAQGATPVALWHNRCTVVNDKARIDSGLAGSGKLSAQKQVDGDDNVGGDLVVPLDTVNLGYLLAATFGAPAGNIYKRAENATAIPTFQLERKIGANYHLYKGMATRKIAISMQGDAIILATFTLAGQSETISASQTLTTPTAISLDRCMRRHAQMYVGAVPVLFPDSVEWSFELDCGAQDPRPVGPRVFKPGIFTPSGRVKMLFDSGAEAILAAARAGTDQAVEFRWTTTTNILSIYLDEVAFRDRTPPVDGPAGILWDAEYRGHNIDGTRTAVAFGIAAVTP